MVKLLVNLTEDEVVEMISVLASLEVISPKRAVRARAKLQHALSESITQLEQVAFSKAVDKFLKKKIES